MELHQKLKCLRLLRGIKQIEAAEAIQKAKAGRIFKTHASVINRHESSKEENKMVPRDRTITVYSKLYEVNKRWLANDDSLDSPFFATVFRPICPYELQVTATHSTFCSEMLTLLPLFYSGLGFTSCTRLHSTYGSAFVFAKRDCHAMLLTNSFDDEAEAALKPVIGRTTKIEEEFFIELTISPTRHVKEAFAIAGVQLDDVSPQHIVPERYQSGLENIPPRAQVCFTVDCQDNSYGGVMFNTEKAEAIIRREFPRTVEIKTVKEAGKSWKTHLSGAYREFLDLHGWGLNDDGTIRR